jgi:hypothetical protein
MTVSVNIRVVSASIAVNRGHSGLGDLLQKASGMEISSPTLPESVAQGDRVLVVGFAKGKVKSHE